VAISPAFIFVFNYNEAHNASVYQI